MTARTRQWWDWGAIALFVALASGWAVTNNKVQEQERRIAAAEVAWASRLTKIEERLTEIYCATVPPTKREGCR